jgi:hypothetical protein
VGKVAGIALRLILCSSKAQKRLVRVLLWKVMNPICRGVGWIISIRTLDILDALSEKRDNAQKNFHEFTEKNQEQVRMRLTDAVFGRWVVDIRELFAAMPSEQKADLEGEFLTAIAEQPNEILKCAMYLFLGYLDGATQFAQSCGGGGSSSDLPWGRDPKEDDRRFAYRCMMQAHRMLKPTQPKRGICGRR